MFILLACSAAPFPGGEAPTSTPADPDAEAPAPVVLNEVQVRNESAWMAEDGGYPDWVELYNAGDAPVALDGFTLTTESGGAWEGEGVLRPGEQRALFSGDDLDFDLDGDGERLALAFEGGVLDRLATGELGRDQAWARVPDGGAWVVTGRPTPNATNGSDAGSTDPSDAIFDPGRVQRVDLALSDASITALTADPSTDVKASFGYDGAWLSSVGVRVKGVYGSLRSLDAKASFKVDFNEIEDRRLRGLENLVLNNMVQDPSYVHEALAYSLWRAAGLPAPRTGWAELWVNGEDWGLYVVVEPVDDTFVRRWFGDDEGGSLWEGAYGVDFFAGHEDLFELDEGEADTTPITELAALLAGEPDEAAIVTLETLVDLDAFLAYMAIEAATLHWDGYTTRNNYRVWHDPGTGLFHWIPWGTDQTFSSDVYVPYDGYGATLAFCLAEPGCAARYDDALLDAADLVETIDLGAELEAHVALLAEAIAADPRGEYDADTVATYQALTATVLAETPGRLRAAVATNEAR